MDFVSDFSVVTSVSIVGEDDPMEMKMKYMTDYQKYSVENQDVTVTQPRCDTTTRDSHIPSTVKKLTNREMTWVQ